MRIHATVSFFLCILSVKGYSLKDPRRSHRIKNKQITKPNETLDVSMEDDTEMSEDEENEGQNYFQGDILTTNEQMEKINQFLHHHDSTKQLDQAEVRGLIKDIQRTWDDGRVYYVIADNVGGYKKKLIRDAIKHWEQRTCLRFIKRTNEEDYVYFVRDKGCSSFIGRKGGKQRLVVGNTRKQCRVGNIIHELGHAVGFYHEMSRPDRDKYVKILWKNVMKDKRNNFNRFSSAVIDSRDISYDYNSIMHYGKRSFGKHHFFRPRKTTIVPKVHYARIGQRIALSEHDITQARLLYKCNENKNNLSTDKILL